MTENDRHETILAHLEDVQFAPVTDLARMVAASPATIRRDIAKLDERGFARKVHGGIATLANGANRVFRGKPYRENEVINVAPKQAIGEAAANLCDDGDTIFVHAGTTCSIFSRNFRHKSLRVYTNSIAVAENIWRSGRSHLHLLGGDLHREPAIFHSPGAWDERFFVAKCFLGTLGIGPDGLLENDPLLVHVIENIVERSNEVIVLTDSTKFSVRARLPALAMERISTLITDDGISDRHARMIESAGVQLVVAPCGEPGTRRE